MIAGDDGLTDGTTINRISETSNITEGKGDPLAKSLLLLLLPL